MKKTIIIVLIGSLSICCAITALGAGGYFWYKNSQETIEEDEGNQEAVEETDKQEEVPNIETVFENFGSINSYKLKSELTIGFEKYEMDYYYVFPNKEYIKISSVAQIEEQITIGDVIYYKDDESEWEISTLNRLGGFQNLFFTDFSQKIEVLGSYLKGESWVYELAEGVEDEYTMYVDRESLFIEKITGKGKTKGEDFEIDFQLYAFDEDINIESPILKTTRIEFKISFLIYFGSDNISYGFWG